MDDAVAQKVFAPGSLLEIAEEVIEFPDKHAPHHHGVKHKVFPNGPQTLVDLFAIPTKKGVAQKEFLVYEDERRTFQQVFDEAAALGQALVKTCGVQKGDRVCALSKNRIEYVVTLIASTSIGAVFVPMNSWWKSKELQYGLDNSGTKVLICDAERYEFAEPILDQVPSLTNVLLLDGPGSEKARPHAKMSLYNEVVAKFHGQPMPPFTAGKDDNAMIMYTSGTTGHPKGVVMTHRSICHAIIAAVAHSAYTKALSTGTQGSNKSSSGDKKKKNAKDASAPAILLTVPLFHATGLHVVCLISIFACRKIVMVSKWEPERALELIEREKITHFTGVPTMVLDMMNHPNFAKYDTSTLQNVAGGGAAPPSTMVDDVGKKFKKASAGQGFGMTETNAIAALNDGAAYRAKPTSCGRAVPSMEIAIWDENDKPVRAYEKGSVMIKGASVMKEYWRKPEATADTITADGWLRTGDVGHLDEDGYLHLGGRSKEIIIRGGENISCVAVEDGVYKHPNVAEVAAIPVPHPTLGEEVGIVVFPKHGGKVSLEEIHQYCDDLAKFQRPTHLYIWPEQLPRGATGKIVKLEIREAIKTQNILSEQQKQQPRSKL